MNIYVVSACWWRVGATVIGAGTRREDAEAIADRHDENDSQVASWSAWKQNTGTDTEWSRDALLADGTVHPSLYQEIVCVPLAGFIGDWPVIGLATEGLATSVPALTRATIVSDLSGITTKKSQPVVETPDITRWVDLGVAPPPTLSGMKEAMELVTAARAENAAMGIGSDRIRVGTGSAERYFRRAVESMPAVPRPSALDGELLCGLTIVVDPEMPHNMIRIGGVAYFVDCPQPGQMIRVSEETLMAWGITSPPG